MKKLFAIATLIAGTLVMVSCGDDDSGSVPPPETDITISGIPESAIVVIGRTLTVTDISVTADAGIQSFTATIGSATIDLEPADFTVGDTELTTSVSATTTDLGAVVGPNTITFTATDVDGETESFIHTLVVEAIGYDVEDIDDLDTNGDGAVTAEPAKEITGSINTDFTFTNDVTWVLAGRVKVTRGATLTIQAGTVIKGREGSGGNATALLVARGSFIEAVGTATAPIIMTTILDHLMPTDVAAGNFESPNLLPDRSGEWGGLIVLGDAPISASASEVQIEGIPTSDPDGLYGGTNETHDAGTIRYVSIRHGGSNIGAGNEINGITFGGVGSGTEVAWVEVVGNQDDGIEWFGGSVNVSNALIWNSGDDSMDTDQDWQGTCSSFLIVTPDGSAFELDGPEGDPARNGGTHTFTGGTVYAGSNIGNLVDWDDDTNAGVNNVYFYGIDPGFYTDGNAIASFGGDGNGTTNSWEITLPGGDTQEAILGTAGAAITTTVGANANTVGIIDAANYAWTFAGDSGALTSIGL